MKHVYDTKAQLNELQLRATPARVAILNLLKSSTKPVDVQTIIKHLNKKHLKTDPATVFRIISIFMKRAIARQIQFNEGKFRYELAGNNDHHHLVCNSCGAIEDILDCDIDLHEKAIQKKKGFLVENHSFEFFGLCEDCQR